MKRVLWAGVLLGLLAPSCAYAEVQFSLYSGYQGSPSSTVDITGTAPTSFSQRWEGNSFRTPVYWGARGTWWLEGMPGWGIAAEYTHAKVYADPLPTGWNRFEFTDGLNIFAASLNYRWKKAGRNWTPYVGAGVGLSVPHVEVDRGIGPVTFDYIVGGPAVTAHAGIEYRFTKRWSIFSEYKFNYTNNEVDLADGGHLKTDVITNAINVGVSFSLGVQ